MCRDDVDLVIDRDEVALVLQPVLLEGEARAAQVVELRRQLRLAADDLELKIRVLELHELLARLDHRALLDVNAGDLPALPARAKNRRDRKHP
jgi:hypothetical protein